MTSIIRKDFNAKMFWMFIKGLERTWKVPKISLKCQSEVLERIQTLADMECFAFLFLTENNIFNTLKLKICKSVIIDLIILWKVTNYVATTATPSSDQIFCAQNKKLVFKETIATFKRVNRFSKLISQIKIHEKTDILIYLDNLTNFINIIFFAFKKNRFT